MTFGISQSKQVDIDMSEVTENDRLALRLEDGTYIYLYLPPGDDRLIFDEELLPAGFKEASKVAARAALRKLARHELPKLKTLYDARPDQSQSLLDFAAFSLRQDVWAGVKRVEGDPTPPNFPRINVGRVVQASFGRHIGGLHLYYDGGLWVASSPVQRITSIDRFEAMVQWSISS